MAKLNTEREHIAELEDELQAIWEDALIARDCAQNAMRKITELKQKLTKRQIELVKDQTK